MNEFTIIDKLRMLGASVSILYPSSLQSLIVIKIEYTPTGSLHKKLVEIEAPLLSVALEEAEKILRENR